MTTPQLLYSVGLPIGGPLLILAITLIISIAIDRKMLVRAIERLDDRIDKRIAHLEERFEKRFDKIDTTLEALGKTIERHTIDIAALKR